MCSYTESGSFGISSIFEIQEMKIFQIFYFIISNFEYLSLYFLVSFYDCMTLTTHNNSSLEKQFILRNSLSSY